MQEFILVTTDADMLVTSEDGVVATFEIVLLVEPLAPVTVPLSTSDATEGVVFVPSVTFTPDDWDVPQSVTVAGQDDDLVDGAQVYQVVVGPTESIDERFVGLMAMSEDLTNIDDDEPGITVSPPTENTTESGGEVTFAAVLNTMPTADVTLTFGSSDPGEGVPAVTSVTFTLDDWDVPHTVRVTGVDDNEQDGDQVYTIEFESIASEDAAYAAIALPPTISITNEDNDTPGVTVATLSTTTSESGGTAMFSVRLDSRPEGDVQVNFETDDPEEGTVDVTSLTFTMDDWDTPQIVTVTGVDDFVDDGDQAYSIVFTAQTGDDPLYVSLSPPEPIALTNTDDDSLGLTIELTSTFTVEFGLATTFSVVLDTAPTADVVVGFDSNLATEGSVDTTSLTFTTADWSIPQIVTVRGVDDSAMDGPQSYAIVFSAITGDDAAYSALSPPPNIDLTNYDDDMPVKLRTLFIDSGMPTYVGHAHFGSGDPSFHVVIARPNEPSMVEDDFRWYLRPGLAGGGDLTGVSLEPVRHADSYMRFDSAMPSRWPPCGEGSTYGWALCLYDLEPVGARRYLAWIDAEVDSPTYRSDVTVSMVPALDGSDERVSFRWGTDRYLRHAAYQIVAWNVTDGAGRDAASFVLEQ